MNIFQLVGVLNQSTLDEITAKGKKFFASELSPFTTSKKRDKMLNELLGKLSDETFNQLAPVLVMQLQFSKKRAEKFKNTDAQADAYIQRRPKMAEYRELIWQRMKEFRQNCQLPL